MIVLRSPAGLTLVRQPDHAALSAGAARAWRRPEDFPPSLWARFLEAVGRHDDGWIEEERRPTLDPGGAPYDFKDLPVPLHTAIWKSGVARLERQDPYVAAVVAQHGRWLYSRLTPRGSPRDRRAAAGFVRDMTRVIRSLVASLREGGSPEELLAVAPRMRLKARQLLSFFDGLSLMLLGAIPPIPRTEALCFAGSRARLSIAGGWRAGGAESELLSVHPWPFAAARVELDAQGLRLARRTFAGPDALAAAMAGAPAARFRWALRPACSPPLEAL